VLIRGLFFSLFRFSDEAAELIDVKLSEEEKKSLLEYLVGNKTFPGTDCWAQAYAGFQFGSFAGTQNGLFISLSNGL
jgi:uncharacterized protein YdiU (UPF0061 family)